MSKLSNRLEILPSINLHSIHFDSGNLPLARNGQLRFPLHFKAGEGSNCSSGLSHKIRLGDCCVVYGSNRFACFAIIGQSICLIH
jgi:hypothetical protein